VPGWRSSFHNTQRDPSSMQWLRSCPSFLQMRLETRGASPQTRTNPHRKGRFDVKRIWAILLMASAVRGADVTLLMTGRSLVPNFVRIVATDQATRMFARIGVQLESKKQNVQSRSEGTGLAFGRSSDRTRQLHHPKLFHGVRAALFRTRSSLAKSASPDCLPAAQSHLWRSHPREFGENR
jgi:hypothetical protein